MTMFRFLMARQQAGFALFIGGYNGSAGIASSEKYLFESGAKSAGASLSSGFWNFGITGNRDVAIIGGGFDFVSNFKKTRKYQYANDSLADSTDLVGIGRRGLAGFSSQLEAFFAGGNGAAQYAVVDAFRYSDSTTSSKTSLDHERWGAGAFANISTGYICGGRSNPGALMTARTDKHSFSGNSWSSGTSLSATREMHAQCASTIHGYIISGANSSAFITAVTKYRMTDDTLSSGTSITTARGDFNAASNVIKAIVSSGNTNFSGFTLTKSVEIYTFSGDSISSGLDLSTGRAIHGFGSASSTPAHL